MNTIKLLSAILLSLESQLHFTQVQGVLDNEIITTYNSLCKEECRRSGSDVRYSCRTEADLDPWGWDWCSSTPGYDYRGKRCKSNHCCGNHGKNYNWCYTEDSSWGYCSPSIIYEGITQRDHKGRLCINPCDTYAAKTSDQFWCLATGHGWSTCSPLPETTIAGRPCRAGHKCGQHGKSYTWCYVDAYDNWDYCGVFEDVSERHDLDHWQFMDGGLHPVRHVMYGSTINSIPSRVCADNSTLDGQDDEAIITLLEIMSGSRTHRIPENEEQRRNAYNCITNFRKKYGKEPKGQPLPADTNSNPIATSGDGPNGVRLEIQGTLTAEDGQEHYSLQLILNIPQPRYGEIPTLATCIISQRLAFEAPRFVSLGLLNSLINNQDILVKQRRVQRRYRRPRPGSG